MVPVKQPTVVLARRSVAQDLEPPMVVQIRQHAQPWQNGLGWQRVVPLRMPTLLVLALVALALVLVLALALVLALVRRSVALVKPLVEPSFCLPRRVADRQPGHPWNLARR